VLDQRYLEYRMGSTKYLLEGLNKVGIPTMQPAGGHAVYIDAKEFLPHVPPEQFPGQSMALAMYLEGGIRACEIGSAMFGKPTDDGGFVPSELELVRIAIPRRRYTQSHVDYVLEVARRVAQSKDRLRGYRIVEEMPHLRHFTVRLAPLEVGAAEAR